MNERIKELMTQAGTDSSGNEYSRSDLFRPIPDMNGKYNKTEVLEVVRKGLQLVNGIDSISSDDIQKWVDRLNISIDMKDKTRYFTINQVDKLLQEGANYMVGLDNVTSYEISAWLDNHISRANTIFNSYYGDDLSETTDSYSYTKVDFKSVISDKLKNMLGAQAAKTR